MSFIPVCDYQTCFFFSYWTVNAEMHMNLLDMVLWFSFLKLLYSYLFIKLFDRLKKNGIWLCAI